MQNYAIFTLHAKWSEMCFETLPVFFMSQQRCWLLGLICTNANVLATEAKIVADFLV